MRFTLVDQSWKIQQRNLDSRTKGPEQQIGGLKAKFTHRHVSLVREMLYKYPGLHFKTYVYEKSYDLKLVGPNSWMATHFWGWVAATSFIRGAIQQSRPFTHWMQALLHSFACLRPLLRHRNSALGVLWQSKSVPFAEQNEEWFTEREGKNEENRTQAKVMWPGSGLCGWW